MKEPDPTPTTDPTPYERFEQLAQKVVNTPKSVIEKDKKARRDAQHTKGQNRRG